MQTADAGKILVAEDEPALLDAYCELVSSLGHECLPAADGDEALDLARREQPTAVVTDYMMPGRSGVDLIRALRADPVLAPTPVILVSAARPPKAELLEAWRFLPKPLDIVKLEAALIEAIAVARERGRPKGFVAQPPAEVSPVSLAREDMLSWVSHEIKTPLSAALTGVQLAMRGLGTNAAPEVLEGRLTKVVRQLRRMDELVNALLDAAQLQDGRLEVALETVDLHDAVERTVAYWSDLHGEIAFNVTEGPALAVEADPPRLRQVLDNLLSNAVKYGAREQEKTSIEVGITADELTATVSVVDHGRGIAKEDLERIFDRFHRVPGSAGRGHGLGLYIAAALARLFGGQITVESEPGVGSTFRLTLPRSIR